MNRAARQSEAGFTIVEVMVAAMLLLIGSLGMMSLVDASSRNTYRAEQSQVVVNQLQTEMEKIRRIPFEEVALTSAPAHSTDPEDPAWRVSGNHFATSPMGTGLRPMVVNGGTLAAGGTISDGVLSPAPTPFESGDVSGTIRRYVVWMNDPKCPDTLCPGDQDLKRVIVAATIDDTASGGERPYQELQSDIVDPDVKPVENPVPPGTGDEGTFATFWLTDTPCNEPERLALTGDHPTHDTLGTCDAGGKPDLMYIEQPFLDPAYPDDEQPLHDYSTDVEPATNGGADKGLQLRKPSALMGSGCALNLPPLESSPEQKMHRWLAPPIPDDLELLLDGEATLSLWTRSINGAVHSGRICVWLFIRRLNALSQPVDTAVVNQQVTNLTGFPGGEANWPSGNYKEVTVEMDFVTAAQALLPGEQLGLAISVERSGTDGDGLEFMYDHPSFDSRLQVKTSSALPIFE
jgi:type II secretory pathway pseudopilin PulG